MPLSSKKICILTSVHPPFDVRIFYKEAKTLVKAGYNVTLIAQHDKNEIANSIKVVALPKPKNRFFRIFFLTRKAYKLALQRKAGIYHFHDPELLPWMVILKKKTKAKVIYDVHEDYSKAILTKEWMPLILRGAIAKIFRVVEKLFARIFDAIIPATEAIATHFPPHKTMLVKNYPILDFVAKNPTERDFKKDNFTLIYAGVLAKIRGIYEIVQSLEYVSGHQVRLSLLGKFCDLKFEEKVRSLNGFSKVEYYGWVPYEEVYHYMKLADIGFVLFHPLPNHLRALPNKLFEYMSVGIPIIASNFPLWKEIIERNNCGICVDPLNPKEIAKAVKYLIEYPEEVQKMGENGRKAVLEKYNWENESKKLIELYNVLR